ncbi:hypothetical protein F1529_05845 [Alcanivorax sp. VBW004]|uniref:hypothetical protein n=1 Tax=Alcanivorax sp. VBW004 TaxID=1287708 RepID=UPI0012BD2DAE|nr:hypothetical protein [Alcanivorax sp. VBW004]MTT52008.1 hypothetical protein [Alcanivorax sp. VBW004]
MQENILRKLIARDRGLQVLHDYSSYEMADPQNFMSSAKELLETVPPRFGDCVMMSSLWAILLRDKYSIPAITIAGDLKIQGKPVFKCKKNVPSPKQGQRVSNHNWQGHCWVGVNGYIGDLSVFRTAYSIVGPSLLKDYIISNFGRGRGGFLSPIDELPSGMKFVPKYVLTPKQEDNQVNAFYHLMDSGSA